MTKFLHKINKHENYIKNVTEDHQFNITLCEDEYHLHYDKYDPYIGYEFVDLGLSVKWAKMNIGANSETDYGQHFQWGDISGYTTSQFLGNDKNFSWADYKYSNNGGSSASDMTKYNSTDGKTVLDTSDDAVVANWGGSWRMPTEAEFNELLTDSTITKEYTSINGVNGYKFSLTADPTKYVFFPAAGSYSNGSRNNVGSYGLYWSSSLLTSDMTYGMNLLFHSGNCSMRSGSRKSGYSVRGVAD